MTKCANNMFKLSCFHFHHHPHTHKPKKISHPAVPVTMQEQECNRPALRPSSVEENQKLQIIGHVKSEKSSPFFKSGRNSDEFGTEDSLINEIKIQQTQLMRRKKSKSLGYVLLEENLASGSHIETDTKQTHDSNKITGQGDKKHEVESHSSQYPKFPPDSVQVSLDRVIDESIFRIGDSELQEKDGRTDSNAVLSDECAKEDSSHSYCTTRAKPVSVKSCSSPNLIGLSAPPPKPVRSRSALDFHVLDMIRKENSFNEGVEEHQSLQSDGDIHAVIADDGYDSYDHVAAKDWVMPVVEEVEVNKSARGEIGCHLKEAPLKGYKTKRIEEWVMEHCVPLAEEDHVPSSKETAKRVANVTDVKMDAKVTLGMEAAMKYIAALSPSSTAAHLANHGLVVIPFMSAFIGLKVLNLSGNAIVRITAGALPRGLHVLNLSKNHISTIEGLRELTRLRILDLSYNRIFRIGHGLDSCSALRELYLAGNKISTVEGLHRLLKLHVLDLRFNKLSTTKCLGQLAANYSSLQAISLDGNPAQKNVGDEQLKKYLLGLLPHLAYYNRQHVDKLTRNFAAHKTSRGHKTQPVISPSKSKGRHGRQLPPSGTQAFTSHKPSFLDLGNKFLRLRSELGMRKSRSEGTLGAL